MGRRSARFSGDSVCRFELDPDELPRLTWPSSDLRERSTLAYEAIFRRREWAVGDSRSGLGIGPGAEPMMCLLRAEYPRKLRAQRGMLLGMMETDVREAVSNGTDTKQWLREFRSMEVDPLVRYRVLLVARWLVSVARTKGCDVLTQKSVGALLKRGRFTRAMRSTAMRYKVLGLSKLASRDALDGYVMAWPQEFRALATAAWKIVKRKDMRDAERSGERRKSTAKFEARLLESLRRPSVRTRDRGVDAACGSAD